MNRFALATILVLSTAAPLTTIGADIVNGWSASSNITRVYSLGSATMFKLSAMADGCGHPDYWSLPLEDTAQSKTKLSILLTAYAAGKSLSLRCENSSVTDFTTLD